MSFNQSTLILPYGANISPVPFPFSANILKGNFEFYGKMKDICNKSSSFFICHKSYVINLNNIKCISKKARMIILGNDLTCFFLKNLIRFNKRDEKLDRI
ncbi:LytTR family transcriptional regulator DNA-binding domain-containing protein [Carnobacterium sp.]|uniref:LytTR family transcriptional regulator DNA-binding domain-containing protein n=1 Tax=Carnobacterium TaxID=2747 RepID=UPI00338E3FB0